MEAKYIILRENELARYFAHMDKSKAIKKADKVAHLYKGTKYFILSVTDSFILSKHKLIHESVSDNDNDKEK